MAPTCGENKCLSITCTNNENYENLSNDSVISNSDTNLALININGSLGAICA